MVDRESEREDDRHPAYPSAPLKSDDVPGEPEANDTPAHAVRWPVRRFHRSGPSEAVHDPVVQERRIELVLNGTPLLALMALPTDVEDLALGFLVSEGLWRNGECPPGMHFDASAGQVRCTGLFDDDAVESIFRRWTFGTGCGGGGTGRDPSRLADCLPMDSRLVVGASRLSALGREFGRMGQLYRLTGGVHACAIANGDSVLLFAEDVGRHNAFDKVAGMALRRGMDLSDKIGLTTGRLSAEIVAKAIAHRLPILASSSAPTSTALEWSRRFGLTLIGFLRGGRMNVYTGYQRVSADG